MEAHEITERRTALGLTQQQFADAIGVHRVTVVKWEAGRARPSALAARLLEETIGRLEEQQAKRAARRAAYAAKAARQNDAR